MFKIKTKDLKSRARTGVLKTAHGIVKTPSYVVVGTEAEVRTVKSSNLALTKTQAIISNTYHLWQKLGDQGLKKYPGLHKAMNWPGVVMTDSGGFQVFSLGYARELGGGKVANKQAEKKKDKNLVRVTDKGVYFKVDGKEQYLDAKKSIKIQEQLGADIILAFDEPSSPYHDHAYTKKALERTHVWAKQCLKYKKSKQQLFGIIQGGIFQDLREQSAKYIGKLDFDGFAIGGAFGSSFGSKAEDTFKELDWVIPYLPEHKPRHLLGIGKVADLFRGVEAGIDTFDCVIPTREARHGSIYTAKGRLNLKKAEFAKDDSVLDPDCDCYVCKKLKIKRSKLRQLFKARNLKAGQYATIHNLYYFNNLMEQIRQAIDNNSFASFKNDYLKQLTQ